MSFDVFFQGFLDGDAARGGADQVRAVLLPFAIDAESAGDFMRISYGDGTADIYLGGSDSMMANHVSGSDPWQLLVEGATAANWVILPVGCPTCLTDEAQRSHLPDGLGEDAVVVSSGAELQRVILTH